MVAAQKLVDSIMKHCLSSPQLVPASANNDRPGHASSNHASTASTGSTGSMDSMDCASPQLGTDSNGQDAGDGQNGNGESACSEVPQVGIVTITLYSTV